MAAMVLVLKKFKINKDNDYEDLLSTAGRMKIFLENVLSGQVPHDTYKPETLFHYCRSLVEGQRGEEPGLAAGSWSVSPVPEEIGEEDAMDIHYFPTMIALATLVFCGNKYAEVRDIPGYEDSLKRGFGFAISGGLKGIGFNSFFQEMESVLILGSGGCPLWLKEHPEACPALAERLLELGREYALRLEKNDTVLEFGGDYKRQFVLALRLLEPLAG